MLYKDGILWCSCTDKKRWKSESCRQNFYHTRNKVPLRKTKISIDAIQCDKNDYYVVDCNVCLCKSGILDEASCTNRTCLEGSKVDDCKYGQVLRLDGELCTCSELGFYIDKLCIKVKGVNTKIEQKDLAILTHEVKGMKENKRTLKDKNLKCEPNSIFNVDCNKCWCSEDGKDMKCTAKLCSPEILKQTMFQDSPNIPEGEKCVKGQTYKKDCGTCTCNENNRMMCSKTACLSPEERDELSKIQQQHSKISQQKEKVTENDQKTVREGNKNHNIKIIEINKNGTPNKKIGFNKSDFKSAGDKKKTIKLNTIQTGNDFEMRAKNDELEKIKLHAHKLGLFEEDEGDEDHDQDNSDYKPIKLTDASGRFPLLNLKVKCTPGRIYTKGCQRCFCCNQKKPRCTNKPCKAMSKKVKVPSDVTPSISGLDFARMASLPHEAAKCTPGKSYKVRCNRCICLANGNLLCENKLCASIAEINANTAWRYNGA
ncbi:uncharacterized protein LOC126376802 [Pectinophora gossypiella]|uniref:uncharacterized protein LOC126376802 n=1 Tax=Pectinophora gossypiella TaxID=13191 RepID=UPI00214E75D4|nr:uncharacterized protein LOC126376802 [Pectinophora gossypiella]